MKHVAAVRIFSLLSAALIFGGCPPSGPQNPPSVVSFTASSDTLAFGGGDVVLSWTVADATSLSLSGKGDVSRLSSTTVHVTQTTTFTLSATNSLGSTTASLIVRVEQPTTPPTITGFTAGPATLPMGGGTVSLLWNQNLATSLFIDNGVGDVTGLTQKSINITQTTTFTLTASNAIGSTTAQTTVTVYVPADKPAINSFSSSPSSLGIAGGTTTLSWNVIDAASLSIDQGVGTVTGTTKSVNVTHTTTFTLTANNLHGATTATTQVTVYVPTTPPIIHSFSASPASLGISGGSTSLSWNVTDGTSFSIDNGVGLVSGTSHSVNVTQTTTFTLTATNVIGSSQAQTQVTVYVPSTPPTINSFSASPSSLGLNGGSTTLSWNVTDASALSIDNGVGVVTGLSSKQVSVTQTTTFTLTATNVRGVQQAPVTVTVYVPNAPPVISSFTASATVLPMGGGSTTLSWLTTDAQTLTVDQGVGDVTGRSSVSVNLAATTAYKLIATNVRGTTQAIVLVTVNNPTSPPSIVSFNATPLTVPSGGGYVTLTWAVNQAQALSIDNGIGLVTGTSSRQVFVSASSTFTLTATNMVGSSYASVGVAVQQPAPVIHSFTASPQSVPSSGGYVTLSWSVTGATSQSIDQGVGNVGGTSTQVWVSASKTFTLTASNSTGSVNASAGVSAVSAPVIYSFAASPSTLAYGGGYSTLTWSTSGATSLSISQGEGAVSGTSRQVYTTTTRTYVLTATNSGGSVTASTTVTVSPQQTGQTVSGRVLYDGVNLGEAGAYVDVLGGGTTTTDSNGNFTLSNVPATFDIAVSDVSNAHVTLYRNMTRTNPTLIHLGVHPTINSASSAYGGLYESTGGSVAPGTLVMFGGPGALSNSNNSGYSGSYSFGSDLQWYGSQGSGHFYAFEGFGQVSPRVGVSSFVNLASGSSWQDITLSAATSYNLWGSCNTPSNAYTVSWKRSGVKLSPNSSIHYSSNTSAASFDLYTAEVSGSEAFVSCQATDGQRTAFAREGGFGGDAYVTLTLLDPPTLLQPSNNATSIGYGSSFSWTAYGTGAHIVHLTPVTEQVGSPEIHMITGAASITMPDLSQLALSMPAHTRYSWTVDGYDPLWDADAASSGTALFDLLTEQGTFSRGSSAANTFYTP